MIRDITSLGLLLLAALTSTGCDPCEAWHEEWISIPTSYFSETEVEAYCDDQPLDQCSGLCDRLVQLHGRALCAYFIDTAWFEEWYGGPPGRAGGPSYEEAEEGVEFKAEGVAECQHEARSVRLWCVYGCSKDIE